MRPVEDQNGAVLRTLRRGCGLSCRCDRYTSELIERIRRFVPEEAKRIGEGRWRLSVRLLTEGLRMIDESVQTIGKQKRRVFEDVLLMIAAALTAPPSEEPC